MTSPIAASLHNQNPIANMLSVTLQRDQAHDSVRNDPLNIEWNVVNATEPGGWPVASLAEARSLHHYIHRISAELDICDPKHHFSRFIPLRAASCPMMAHALLAFASKHLSGVANSSNGDDHVEHYSKCLELLIPRLNDPQAELDDDVLATVLLLRKYEEYDGELTLYLPYCPSSNSGEEHDQKTHLAAAARMTSVLSTYAKSGGLREAASWVSLRQDSYVSFTQQQPLKVSLDIYAASETLLSDTPEALANCTVLLWARALDFAFGDGHKHDSRLEMWQSIHADLEACRSRLPWNAMPLWSVDDPATTSDRVFPEVLMCHPAHVIALQHDSLARIVLALYNPMLPQVGLGARQKQAEAEATARHHMKLAVGLAQSNPQVENAFHTASHVLITCESYLVDQTERRAAFDFLEQSCAKTGWPIRSTVERMRYTWNIGTISPTVSTNNHV